MSHPRNLIELYSGSDLDLLFKGNFINFGYWKNLLPNTLITESEAIEANKQLYHEVFKKLNLNEQDQVLEIGCGHGAGCRLLAESYSIESVVGLDFLISHIKRSEQINASFIKKNKVKLKHGQAESMPFTDSAFHKAYSIEAFQHMCPQKTFSELARVLSHDGKLVISTFFAKNQDCFGELLTLLPRPALLPDRENQIDSSLPSVLDWLTFYKFVDIEVENISPFVWLGYDRWVQQNHSGIWDKNWLIAYQKGLIDYYIISACCAK